MLLTVFTRVASTFLNFLLALIIARHAGPVVKGEVTLLITTVWFIMFLSNILGGPVLVFVIPRTGIDKLLGPAYVWALLVSLLSFAVLWLVPLHNTNYIIQITAISLLSSIISIHHTLLLAKQEINKANALSILILTLQTVGVFICFYLLNVHSAYAFIYSTIAAHVIGVAVSLTYMWSHVQKIQLTSLTITSELKLLIRHGFLYQLVEILQLLNLRYYFFQLGLQQGNKYLGIYSIGISILESVWLIPRSIATVHYISTANSNEVQLEANRTLRLAAGSFALCLVALTILWLTPNDIFVFVFGEGFSDVKHSVRFLFPGILVYSLWIVVSSFYFGTGRYKPVLFSSLVGVISLIVCSTLLIPQYVMSGAGLAATISFTLATLTLAFYFQKEVRF
jgi:O-antigen/teichoic acid export membrane protein